MTEDRDYQAEFDALASIPDGSDDDMRELASLAAKPTRAGAPHSKQPEPEVGTSETARLFAQSGVFAELVAQQQQEREAARKRAIEESQGYTFQGLREAAHTMLATIDSELPEQMPGKGLTRALSGLAAPQGKAGVLGDNFGMLSPEERKTAAQEELEFRQRSAPFTRGIADSMPAEWTHQASEDRMTEARADVEMGHTVRGYAKMAAEYTPTRWLQRFLKGSANSVAERQANALAAAQAMARGEIALPEKTWWRDRIETGAATIANFSSASLIQYAGIALGYAGRAGLIDEYAAPLDPWDNKVTKFGRDLEKYVNELFPGDKARQYEFAKMATQGVASTIAIGGTAKMINGLIGGGATGINAAVSLAGAAALTPEQFGKVTEAMKKGNATELDRLLVFLGNSALGSTERFGVAPMFAGRGVTGARASASGFLKEGIDEGLQEMGQQYGQNQLTRATYDPKQDPYEGVAEGGAIGFITGGVVGGIAPIGREMLDRAAARRAGRSNPGGDDNTPPRQGPPPLPPRMQDQFLGAGEDRWVRAERGEFVGFSRRSLGQDAGVVNGFGLGFAMRRRPK